MAKFTLVNNCRGPSKNQLSQNQIDCCVLWLKYLVGASVLLVIVSSIDDAHWRKKFFIALCGTLGSEKFLASQRQGVL